MSCLGYLFLFGTALPTAVAAPLRVPDVVTAWVPANFKPVQLQGIYDFLNPFYTPSVTQAVISCIILILLSAIIAVPTAIPYPEDSTRFQVLCKRIHYAVHGLVAPDLFSITSWLRIVGEAYPAVLYNRLYNKDVPKKFKWTALHGAFIMRGGFVLWEDNKPAKVLRADDIFRMVKSGEIELPALSMQDILARSTRSPGYIAVWFLVLPICWFIRKFVLVLPTFTLLAVTHGLLSWYAYFWRSRSICTVVEPIILFRKAGEVKKLIDVEDGASQASNDSEKSVVDANVADPLDSVDLSEKPMNSEDEVVAVPAKKSKAFLFSFALKSVCSVLLATFVCIFGLLKAVTSPMTIQWLIISSKTDLALRISGYIAGTVVTLLGWARFYSVPNKIPFPSDIEQHIWRISSLFVTLQPFILLLAPRWIRSKIWGSLKQLIWIIYNLAYATARISIFVIAVRGIKLAT